MLKGIIAEADEYKAEFIRKWKARCENNRVANREKEKVRLIGLLRREFLQFGFVIVLC